MSEKREMVTDAGCKVRLEVHGKAVGVTITQPGGKVDLFTMSLADTTRFSCLLDGIVFEHVDDIVDHFDETFLKKTER